MNELKYKLKETVLKNNQNIKKERNRKNSNVKTKFKKSKELQGFLYLLPAMIIISIFQIYPIFKSLSMSFYTKYDYLNGIVYERGLDNFRYVFEDPDFYLALKNTSLFVLGSVPLSILIALFFAIQLNKITKFKKLFRSIYFLPFITSTVAISVVWRWMFSSNYGIINEIIFKFGINKIRWLANPKMTIPILIILSVWKGLGYKIILFLAGLQSINQQYYQAAKLDGANKWNRFKNITIPLLSPTLFFVLITSIISSAKIFDEVFILYDKQTGPLKSGLTIVYYIFNKFYNHWQFSIAAAATFILFIIILIITMIQIKISKKITHY